MPNMQLITSLEPQVYFKLLYDGFLLIDMTQFLKMQKYRQLTPNSVESGGLLFGFERTPHVQITGVTTPCPKDNQSRFRWERCDPTHISLVESANADSGAYYLGEWHTHPEDNPKPSSLDIREWEKIAKKSPSHIYVFIIIGRVDVSVYTFVLGQLHRATHIEGEHS